MKDKARAERWSGLRQDSGNPMVYAPRAKEIYESMGIDYKKKSIIYSDALTVDKALKIKEQCDEVGFACEWCGCAYIHVAERFNRLVWNRDVPHE